MILLVTGDRYWRDRKAVKKVLKRYKKRGFTELVHGDAPGLDRIAGQLGVELGFTVHVVPAHWRHNNLCPDHCREMVGKPAGVIRNAKMLAVYEVHEFAAFHDDIESSRGTKDMMKKCKRKGVPGKLYKHKDSE